jgi:CRISPR-associated protein Csx3
MKVVLCGPAQSGKSCLREGLKQAIRRIPGAPYPYVITACPDGEGSWYSEAARRNPELARQLKAANKAKFTPEFAQVAAQWVRDTPLPFNIIDVGGKIDEKNRLIMTHATHAVILAGDMNKVPAWKEFCSQLNLKIIALIHSDYHGVSDRVKRSYSDSAALASLRLRSMREARTSERASALLLTAHRLESETPILQGSIHYLERGQDVSTRPMVQALARLLIHLSTQGFSK